MLFMLFIRIEGLGWFRDAVCYFWNSGIEMLEID